jgi:uncharacterized membrane protein
MDQTHVHLVFTHFPIVGTVIGIGILTYGVLAKNDVIKKTALVIFILMALLTIPVFLTGEAAEETVEHLAGVSENIIKQHEELAEKAIWLIGLLGFLSLANILLIFRNSSFAKTVTLITLVASLATFGLFAKVGNLGGQIRHTEIRANNTVPQVGYGNGIENQHEEEDD